MGGGTNIYSYVVGNALRYVDPLGLVHPKEFVEGCSGVGCRMINTYDPEGKRSIRIGVFGRLIGCASFEEGDTETQISLQPAIGGGLSFCMGQS